MWLIKLFNGESGGGVSQNLIYVSDKFKYILFDDDINIYSNRNYEYVENTVNSEFDKVNQWLYTS